MKTGTIILGVIAALIVILGVSCAGKYNKLVTLDQAVSAEWAQVQNVYQRRADLVPNLVETVKGAANFEKDTMTAVTDARAKVGSVTISKDALTDPAAFAKFQQAQDQLSGALSHLLAVAEAYPDLKATQNFRDLQAQLEGTENRISVERGKFNDAVGSYDTAVNSMPARLYAGAFGFQPKPYFTAREGSDVPPPVNFNFGNATPAPTK